MQIERKPLNNRRVKAFLTVFAVLLLILTAILLLAGSHAPARTLRRELEAAGAQALGAHRAYAEGLEAAAGRLSAQTVEDGRSYLSAPLVKRMAQTECSGASDRIAVRDADSGTVLFSTDGDVPDEPAVLPDAGQIVSGIRESSGGHELYTEGTVSSGGIRLSLQSVSDVTETYERARQKARTISLLILVPVVLSLAASVTYVFGYMRREGGSYIVRKLIRAIPWGVSLAAAVLAVVAGALLPGFLLKHAERQASLPARTETASVSASSEVRSKLPGAEEVVTDVLTATYSSADFGVPAYVSAVDGDGDGIDDQTDIYESALAYVAGKPAYVSEYYDKVGYAPGDRGVCTDVIAFGFVGAGYDLMEMINADIRAHPEDYPNAEDEYIDFRRVENQLVFFEKYAAESLTTDFRDGAQWQAGDIVVFEKHIGLAAEGRNWKGIPLLLHHGREDQTEYIEDRFEVTDQAVVGHFRWR